MSIAFKEYHYLKLLSTIWHFNFVRTCEADKCKSHTYDDHFVKQDTEVFVVSGKQTNLAPTLSIGNLVNLS